MTSAVEYDLRLLTPAGVKLATLDAALFFKYGVVLNDMGRFSIGLPGDFNQSVIAKDNRVAIWRRAPGSALKQMIQGPLTWWQLADDDSDQTTLTIAGPSLKGLLHRRIIAFAAKTWQARQSDHVDTMLRSIVRLNAGVDALADRQLAQLEIEGEVDYELTEGNLLTNGSAESGAWPAFNGATVTQSTDWTAGDGGTYSCKIVVNDAVKRGAIISDAAIAIVAGVPYVFTLNLNVIVGSFIVEIVRSDNGVQLAFDGSYRELGEVRASLSIAAANAYTGNAFLRIYSVVSDGPATCYADNAIFNTGPIISKSFAWANVLDTLQTICDSARADGHEIYFDLIPQDGGTFKFITTFGQPGLDRRIGSASPLIFSKARGNLKKPCLTTDYDNEVNVVYGGGPGEGISRRVKVVSDAGRIALSAIARSEGFADARMEEDTDAAVIAAANAALVGGQPVIRFTGDLVDVEHSRYGVDWDVGYRVSAEFAGLTFADCLIRSANVEVDDKGVETVEAKLEWSSNGN